MKKRKTVELRAKEDRISALPDSIIQHILSFLPSTEEVIRTSLISKSFRKQWTRVPALKFHSSDKSHEEFSKFITNTLRLYDSSKIKKFHIQSDCIYSTAIRSKINFAIKKDVEELSLKFRCGYGLNSHFRLPISVFNHASLVKLEVRYCSFCDINSMVNWGHLKVLNIERCTFEDVAIEDILRGSPSLELLEITFNSPYTKAVIASESLKKLVLKDVWLSVLQISCPNLEELNIVDSVYPSDPSEPELIMNWPSLIRATLDFEEFNGLGRGYYEVNIIQHLQHVKELKLGSRLIETMSGTKVEAALSSLLLNNKSLILDSPNFQEHATGIACALHSSHVLEKLLIKLPLAEDQRTSDFRDLNVSSENYWNSNKSVFNCLSHLKTVEIHGLSESDNQYEFVLNFVDFLLKNARALEKFVVILEDGEKVFYR